VVLSGARAVEKQGSRLSFSAPTLVFAAVRTAGELFLYTGGQQSIPFELRNPVSYSGVIHKLLERHSIAFCIHYLPGRETPYLVTSSLVYVGFHGSEGWYSGSYSDSQLELWASRIESWANQGREVLVYFNNDIGGHAIQNARTLYTTVNR